MSSLLILSSLVYPVTLLRKRISAASRPVAIMGITLSRMGWTGNVTHRAKNEKTQIYWEKFKETGHLREKGHRIWGVSRKYLGGLDTAGFEQCPVTFVTSINR